MLIHFYSTYIRDGGSLDRFRHTTLKEYETIMKIHTRMIMQDVERKEKELVDKQQKEADRLLHMLREQTQQRH